MIKSIKHKGLKTLFYKEDGSKIPQNQLVKIKMILDIIDELEEVPKDLSFYHSLRPHQLKGEYRSYWSLDVSGNYRIIFKFKDKNAYDLDYLDTH